MKIEVPFEIGDVLKVNTRILPTSDMDFGDDGMPDFLKARVVSVRKSRSGVFVKLAVRAPWVCELVDHETGPYEEVCDTTRFVSVRARAFGKTVLPL